MSDAYLEAPTSEELTTEHLAAGADRRFYAFVVDRLFAWGVIGGEAYAAYTLLIEPGRLWAGVAADRRHRADGRAARLDDGRHLRR